MGAWPEPALAPPASLSVTKEKIQFMGDVCTIEYLIVNADMVWNSVYFSCCYRRSQNP